MHHFKIFAVAALLSIACEASRAYADQPAPSPSPSASPKELDSVVVTAQRHATPLERTPRQTFVVTAADLERLGATTVADALRFLPGSVVQQYGAFGSLETVALRGASSAQTLVLVDGRPVTEADTGVFDYSSLPAGVVDRIEVVQGGSSTLYGSAAMGGVINIVTKNAANSGAVDAFAQFGYQGSSLRGVGFALGEPRSVAARVDVQAASANNTFDYPPFGKLEPAGTRTNDDAKLQNAHVALNARLGSLTAAATVSDNTSEIGAPGNVLFASSFARQQRVYQRANLSLALPLGQGDVALQLFSDGRRLHFFDLTSSFPYDTLANGTSRGAQLRMTTLAGSSNTVTAGFDARGDVVMFDATFAGAYQGPKVTRDASSAWYVQDELHAPNSPFTASAGVRNERVQGTKSTTVPTAGVLMRLSNSLDAQANYARAFRAPSLDERYYPGFGDPAVQPEYGATFDVGLRSRGPKSSAALTYFGQDTNNLIISVVIDSFGNVKPANVSRSRVRGLEASAQAALSPTAQAQISYTNFLRAVDLTPGLSGNRLLYRPSATGSLSVWVRKAAWEYGLDSRFVGARYADEANTQRLPAYLVGGVHVKRMLSRRIALTLRWDNASDNRHAEEALGYPVVGSAFSVRLSTP